jgi:hypothetical protein
VLLFLEHFPEGRVVVPQGYREGAFATCREVLGWAGVDDASLIFADPWRDIEADHVVLIDLPYAGGVPHPWVVERYAALRGERAPGPSGNGRTYFLRGAPNREIENHQHLAPTLERFGFSTADVGSRPLADQVHAWKGAQDAMAILGSDMTNMLLAPPERLLSISPHWFGDHFFYGLAAALGVEWSELICGRIVREREPRHRSSFEVDPEDFAAFLSASYDGRT